MTCFFRTWYLVFTYGNILILPIALHVQMGPTLRLRSDEAPQYPQRRRM